MKKLHMKDGLNFTLFKQMAACVCVALLGTATAAYASGENKNGYFQYRAYDSFWNPESAQGPDLFWHSGMETGSGTVLHVAPILQRTNYGTSYLMLSHIEDTGKNHLQLTIANTTGLDSYNSEKNKLEDGLSHPLRNTIELPASFGPTHMVQIPKSPNDRESFSDYGTDVLLYDAATGHVKRYGAAIGAFASHEVDYIGALPSFPQGLTTITPLWINNAPAYVLYRENGDNGILRVVQLEEVSKLNG